MTMITTKARLLEAVCRNDFASFARKCYHTLSPGSPFHPNWHILAMAYHLEQVRLGKIKRLIINVPPRSLKSVTSSVALSAWILGHDPSEHIVAVSYRANGEAIYVGVAPSANALPEALADSGPLRTVIPTHCGQRSGDRGQLPKSV